jgi:orotate phosphoribosyltransferase
VEIIQANGAVPAAVLIAIDRMERSGNAEKVGSVSAVKEVEKLYGMPVVSIASLKDLLGYLQKTEDESLRRYVAAVEHYRELYGA